MSAAQEFKYRNVTQAEAEEICDRHDRLWRGAPGGARANFSFCDLSNIVLPDRDLTDANFTAAMLNYADMRGCKLDNATFFMADLRRARLTGASMRRVDLRGA